MSEASQQPASPNVNARGVTLVDTFLPALDDDLALGCECANPLLQIERWSQEAQQSLHAS